MLKQSVNMWQSHSNSCETFLLLSSWLIAIWASSLKLCSCQGAPYLWHSPGVQEAFWHTRNDSAIDTKLQKSCCPHRGTEIPSKSYVNRRNFRWRLGAPFICLYIWSSFMKLTSVSISNSAKFFILTWWNEHLLLITALKNTWHRWILSWVLVHCKTQKHNEFRILKDPKALWPKLFM